jgi:hypothetical protein
VRSSREDGIAVLNTWRTESTTLLFTSSLDSLTFSARVRIKDLSDVECVLAMNETHITISLKHADLEPQRLNHSRAYNAMKISSPPTEEFCMLYVDANQEHGDVQLPDVPRGQVN